MIDDPDISPTRPGQACEICDWRTTGMLYRVCGQCLFEGAELGQRIRATPEKQRQAEQRRMECAKERKRIERLKKKGAK